MLFPVVMPTTSQHEAASPKGHAAEHRKPLLKSARFLGLGRGHQKRTVCSRLAVQRWRLTRRAPIWVEQH
eukprot:3546041-Amphidinium_carterae.1